MPVFGKDSLFQFRTLHPRLQSLLSKVVARYDCKITEGHRGEEAQNRAFREGKSKLRFPNGNHNAYPSRAADVYPFPVALGGPLVDKDGKIIQANLQALLRFHHFAGYVQGVAAEAEIEIRWGGDWDSDFDFTDERFRDLVHFELTPKEK